ncbi:protein-disulfide reductase DsbD [Aureimonas ureilytica]|uniref:protein-disulfide reductase DsbD n=1 Tax=Aureimonas ureilytica TaxID=401562 RepID=UPI0003797058|nr:protein-disulfide reductase DsbD [Aureimonas ureilytica]
MPLHRLLPFVLALFVVAPAAAQVAEPLPVDQAFRLTIQPGTAGSRTTASFEIADGYYLYKDRIAVETPTGAPLAIDLPAGERKDDPTFGSTEVYHRAVSAGLALPSDLPPELTVTYQGCQEGGICYRPVSRTFDPAAGLQPNAGAVSAPRSAAGWTAGSEPTETTVSNLPTDAASSSSSGIRTDASAGGLVVSLLGEGGAPWVVASFFVLGLGLAFTPCVFPMYPILAGQLSRGEGRVSPARGFSLSLAYVLSMAAAFGLLGLVAAWSGQNLQLALQSPTAVVLMSAVFVGLALSMFGLFELRLPGAWVNAVAGSVGRAGGSLPSSAALGFTSALIVGPCVTAPLAGALIYIAQSGDVALGAAALFALGLGQGVPLLAFGTLGARVLPRAGPWMVGVTRAFGFAFLALAVWMLSRVVPPPVTLLLWSALLIGGGVFLGAFDHLTGASGAAQRVAKATGLLAILYGAILAVGASSGGVSPLRPLALGNAGQDALRGLAASFQTISDPEELSSTIASSERPTLLYFTADWCVSCDVIEREVFSDPAVRMHLNGYRLLKADLTRDEPGGRALMRDLGVVGPPTILFVDRDAREVGGSRLVGEVSAETFLRSARLGTGG